MLFPLTGNDMLENANELHILFQACYRRIKHLRSIAFLLDLLSVLTVILNMWYSFSITPLIVLIFSIVAYTLRLRSDFIRVTAEKCRRISVRSFAFSKDVPEKTVIGMLDETPNIWKLNKENFKRLDEYYKVIKKPGKSRLHEMYAHSSFFSWYLLKFTSIIYAIVFVALLSLSILVFYFLAIDSINDKMSVSNLLGIFCSIILANYTIKCFDRALSTYISHSQIKNIQDQLLDEHVSDVDSLTRNYDSLVEKSHYIPTFVHKYNNASRSTKWERLQKALYGGENEEE